MLFSGLALVAGLAASAAAAPAARKDKRSYVERDGVTHTIFEHAATNSTLDYVTNSGICETTEGVNQYSGYFSVGDNMNMWFWFFESRDDPTTAPFAMWLNGGPGCSSMIGLFQENGPCQFYNGSSEPSLNPYSYNEYANMIYVDQPIGVGFSYGTDDVTSTVTAAPYVWTLLQAFYAQFPEYENRDFGLFTESYGGHYGPEFADYFQTQNAAIDAGTVTGEKIDLVALGINNGWYDPLVQYEAYVTYSYNNSYNQIIKTEASYNSYMNAYTEQCAPALADCTGITGNNSACISGDSTCAKVIENPIGSLGNFDAYDIREPANDPYPPSTYENYIAKKSVMNAIGANSTWSECPYGPYVKFSSTGDDARSFLPTLSTVVQSGIQVLLFHGDADWICNYVGGFNVANLVEFNGTAEFNAAELQDYTVDGTSRGLYKTVDNFSWLQVYEAGHEVPYYQPATALQAFKQTLSKQPISST